MFSIFQLFFQKYLWKIRNISTDVGVVVWNILKWVIFKPKDLPWQSWFLIIWIGERGIKNAVSNADTAFFYYIEVWCIVMKSGEGLGAVLVVAGLSLFAEPDENEDPAYQGGWGWRGSWHRICPCRADDAMQLPAGERGEREIRASPR